MGFLQRWRDSFRYRQGLDTLLDETPSATAPLRDRVDWLGRLVNWVRVIGAAAEPSELVPMSRGRLQSTRLKFILQVLERNPELKRRVSECLHSVLRDTHSLELFMHAGVPNQQGFIGELVERITIWALPQPPDDKNLEYIFRETFKQADDAAWIERIDPEVFKGWLELFRSSDATHLADDLKTRQEIQDALFLLSHAVRSVGLSRIIRNRVAERDFRKLPFFTMTDSAERLIAATDPAGRKVAYEELNQTLHRCFSTIDEVYGHYRLNGVSIELVYQTERLKALLQRCRTLGQLLVGDERSAPFIQSFFALLVRENLRTRRIGRLLSDNFVLVCRKIVETNAEIGEHYITRDGDSYSQVLKKAWGGGIVTGFTTLFKFLVLSLKIAPFFIGFLAFANYAVSFVFLQLTGLTLATKQPAMTATVLAAKIEDSGHSIEPLIDEIIFLIRSQFTTVMGNLTMVVPMVMLLDGGYQLFGQHMTDPEHGEHVIDSLSILGMTPLYAAGTGVLLWLSSVFAGWFGNWFNFRGMPEAIQHNARLRFVLGPGRATRFGAFLKNHAAGFAANISLAFLLGMTPQIASFFGFPFDVRHVTLSSGTLAASAMAVGTHVFSEAPFWLAVGGIGSMAVLNLAVSFALALTVAVWAKRVSAPQRGVIYRALLAKFIARPWSFFIAPRKTVLLVPKD